MLQSVPKTKRTTSSETIYQGLIVALPTATAIGRLSAMLAVWWLWDMVFLVAILLFVLLDHLTSTGWKDLESINKKQTIKAHPYLTAAIDAIRILFFTVFVAIFSHKAFLPGEATLTVTSPALISVFCFGLFLLFGAIWTFFLRPSDICSELICVISKALERDERNLNDRSLSSVIGCWFLHVIRAIFQVFTFIQKGAFCVVFPLIGVLTVTFPLIPSIRDWAVYFPTVAMTVISFQIFLKIWQVIAFAFYDHAATTRTPGAESVQNLFAIEK